MLTVKEAAAVWGVSACRVRQYLKEGRITGARKFGRDWVIPKDAPHPSLRRPSAVDRAEPPVQS
jgi:excisionase family DNA binding protein